jgi:hypothetical protein
VRLLDWEDIARQREAMGLADGQIAGELGLTREQVMFIRNSERVAALPHRADGVPSRSRRRPALPPERVVRLEDRFSYGEDALRLRAALQVRRRARAPLRRARLVGRRHAAQVACSSFKEQTGRAA